MKAEDLVGSYVGRGRETIAAGSKARGPQAREAAQPARIVYTKEGLVFAISTPAGRAPTGVKDVREAPNEVKARLADDVVAYAGRYEMKDGKVLHHIEVSFFPDLVGRTNVRTPSFEGKVLTLTTEPDQKGGVQKIYWERIEKA